MAFTTRTTVTVEIGDDVVWTRGIDSDGKPFGSGKGRGTDDEHREIAAVLLDALVQVSERLGVSDPIRVLEITGTPFEVKNQVPVS